MKKKILCCGCSFTKRASSKVSYCDYLGENDDSIVNIGQASSGIGISLLQVESFLQAHCKDLTHFIFQVPSPSRQPITIKREFSKAYLQRFRCVIDGLSYDEDFVDDEGIWTCLLNGEDVGKIETIFFDKLKYYEVSLKLIDIITDKLLRHYPELKIILLRYEKTNCPLIKEFSKAFYKKALKSYCKEKGFQYIYLKQFETEFFRKKGYTYDETHPNDTGAKLIAREIQGYL